MVDKPNDVCPIPAAVGSKTPATTLIDAALRTHVQINKPRTFLADAAYEFICLICERKSIYPPDDALGGRQHERFRQQDASAGLFPHAVVQRRFQIHEVRQSTQRFSSAAQDATSFR